VSAHLRSVLRRRAWPLATLLLVLGACSAPPPAKPPVPTVTTQTISSGRLDLEQQLAGRTVPHMVSEVRPQVGGIIRQRLFVEGQEVKAGQVLYEIDPATYQAAYDNARAQLAQAEAAVSSARPRAERYRQLVAAKLISRQDGDDADATLAQDEAAVVAARAAVRSAQINLDYTRVTAPIAGRIGTSTYTPGALVAAGQDSALTTIQQLDPIYVDVTQTSAQLLALRKQLDSGALKALDGKAQVRIVLEDGSTYAHVGSLEFVGTSVDPGTGNVILRAVVPNPDGLLLPGTYVRAVLPMAVDESAILVPQSAVGRNNKGEATVLLVAAGDKVEQRIIQVGDAIKDQWVVNSGLKAGDRLIVAGGSKVSPGQVVKAGTADAAASAAAVAANGKPD